MRFSRGDRGGEGVGVVADVPGMKRFSAAAGGDRGDDARERVEDLARARVAVHDDLVAGDERGHGGARVYEQVADAGLGQGGGGDRGDRAAGRQHDVAGAQLLADPADVVAGRRGGDGEVVAVRVVAGRRGGGDGVVAARVVAGWGRCGDEVVSAG